MHNNANTTEAHFGVAHSEPRAPHLLTSPIPTLTFLFSHQNVPFYISYNNFGFEMMWLFARDQKYLCFVLP